MSGSQINSFVNTSYKTEDQIGEYDHGPSVSGGLIYITLAFPIL
jgi:hypothetical protein